MKDRLQNQLINIYDTRQEILVFLTKQNNQQHYKNKMGYSKISPSFLANTGISTV